ncbi:MAG TPA: Hsp70 family protein [Polyangiaceae bacterium]|nr:Hsp70 family protein [Polyangiaceae bacterium]
MATPFRPEIYAVDFGTSNSLLAAASAEATSAPIPLDEGEGDPTVLRSLLFFEQGRFSCGSAAVRDFVEGGMQGRFIRSLKKYLPDKAFSGTQIGARVVTIEDLVGRLLREMRERADRHFGARVERVVLGRPAKFSLDAEGDALAEARLERAAEIAGFAEVHFCPEPVAAAHDFRLALERPMTVLVADFGGGTSDYTVVRMGRDGFGPGDVLSLGGISVAGDALDGSLMRHKIARHFGAEVSYRVPLGGNVLTMPKPIVEKLCSPADMVVLQHRDVLAFLRDVRAWSLGPGDQQKMNQLLTLVEDSLAFQVFDEIEQTKCALSDATGAEFVFEYPSMDIREWVERAEFEAGSERETGAVLRALDRTVSEAGLAFGDVDAVCCTGGTARVPRIARAIEERFGREKVRQLKSFHSVVQGLAERARQIAAGSAH